MRITFAMTTGLERPAGRRYFPIARELVKRGHQVRILALHPDLANCPQRRYTRDGVEIWYVGQMHARKHGSQTIHFGPLALLLVLARSTGGMAWGLLCSPADVYHLCKPQPINGLAALLVITLLRRQHFYVDWDDDEVKGNRLTAGWQRAVFGFWQWLLPAFAAGTTVNTTFLAERLRVRGIEPVVLVPNGADRAAFHRPTKAQLAGLRASLGLEGRRVIAYAGTLSLQNHPVDLLVAAFALLTTRLPDVALLIIGGGEDLEALRGDVARRGLEDRVYFTGHVAHRFVPHLLALAELSVDPVHDDDVARARSPLKLYESFAVGVPVVTGAVGDRAATLAAGGGWLCPPDDAQALADTLADALGDPVGLREQAARATARAADFEWLALAAHWSTVYTDRK